MPVTPQNEANEENEPPIVEYITAQRARIYNLAEFALVTAKISLNNSYKFINILIRTVHYI